MFEIFLIVIFAFITLYYLLQKIIQPKSVIHKLTNHPIKDLEFSQLHNPNVSSDKLPGVEDFEIMRHSYKGKLYPIYCTIPYRKNYSMKIYISYHSIKMTIVDINQDIIMNINFNKNRADAFCRLKDYFYNYYYKNKCKIGVNNIIINQ